MALRHAARELLGKLGWRGLTVERVAERAGVARTTVYRRHGSLDGLLLLLLDEMGGTPQPPDTGTLRGDLFSLVQVAAESSRDGAYANVLSALIAAQQHNAELRESWQVRQRRQHDAVAGVLDRARARGEIEGEIDPLVVVDLLGGAVVHRMLVQCGPIDDAFSNAVVDTVIAGIRAR